MGKNRLNTKKFLSIVPFRKLLNWSVPYLTGSKIEFTTAYPMVRIGNFLSRNRTPVTVEDEKEYVRVRIKTHNGGVERREKKNVLGKSIGTKKQYAISEGQFIISKIDARNGAMGIVPKELEGAIVTQDFLPYDIDTSIINPQYFVLVSTTKPFVDFCQSCSSGTTNRQRINEEEFLNIQIPVPQLKEQERIINNYQRLILKAINTEKTCEEKEKLIKEYIGASLGLSLSEAGRASLLSIIHFKDTLVRWDTFSVNKGIKASVPIVHLGSLITGMATGATPPTNNKDYFRKEVKFFTPSDIGESLYLSESERFISRKAVIDRKARLFHMKDLLFVGIGSTVGKVGLVADIEVSANQQITGMTLDETKILPEFAYYFLSYNKEISTAEQSKTTLPIINQEKIANIPIPLPMIEKQKEMVICIKRAKKEIQKLKVRAMRFRVQAITDFESKIFD